MSDTALLEALEELGERIGTRIDGLASRDQVSRLGNQVDEVGGQVDEVGGQLNKLNNRVDGLGGQVENLQTTVDQLDGYVRTHGEDLAGHQQWRVDHDKAHEGQDKDFRSLSKRINVYSAGSGLLATVAMILQRFNL